MFGTNKHFLKYKNFKVPSMVSGILVTPQEECAHDNNITYNRQGIMGMFLLPKTTKLPNDNMLSLSEFNVVVTFSVFITYV